MLTQPRPNIPFTVSASRAYLQALTYALRVLFSTNDAAPISNPYVGEVGQLDTADANSIITVSGGLANPNGTPAVLDGMRAGPYTLMQGRVLLFETVVGTTASSRIRLGLSIAGLNNPLDFIVDGTGAFRDTAGTFETSAVVSNYMLHLFVVSDGYVCLFIRQLTQGAKPTWTLRWVYEKGISGSYYATFALGAVAGVAAQNWKLDNILVYDSLRALFTTAGALVTVDAPTPTLSSLYSAAGVDPFVWVTVTAAAVLAGSFDLRFRVVNSTNYAAIRLDSAGQLTVVSVVAGVVANTHVTVAALIAGSGVVTFALNVSSAANTSTVYTKTGAIGSSNAWTKRGSAFAVNSALAAGSGVQVEATSYTASGLKAWVGRSAALELACTEALPYLVCDGDSLTLGQGVTAQLAYPPILTQQLADNGKIADFVNIGSGGQTVQTITGTIAANAAAYYVSTRPKNIYILWAGTNDLVNQVRTPAQAYADLQTACALARAAGYLVVVGTIIARDSTGIGASFDTDRLTFNALLTGNNSFADGFVDFAANAAFDVKADAANTTYYNADKVHLTATGYALIASLLQPVVAALI